MEGGLNGVKTFKGVRIFQKRDHSFLFHDIRRDNNILAAAEKSREEQKC